VEPDLRDDVVDFVKKWVSEEFSKQWILARLKLQPSKYYSWESRYGKDNFHNGKIPRDFWITKEESKAIVKYYQEHVRDGYRRATYMMLDDNIAAVSPATVYRVLQKEGVLRRWNTGTKSKKGTGFEQPLAPHEHWHTDISYINICGTFYYFIAVLDGCSRFLLHWDIRESMTEDDVAIVIQKAHEKFPQAKPRVISDNGSQFISKDFKEFIRISGMTHVRTSPYYPQSNGKFERFNRTLKAEAIRPNAPLSLEDAKRIVAEFVDYYNTVRLHSAIGFITPLDKINGKEHEIFNARDAKLDAARVARKALRDQQDNNIQLAA
jgi:transposase InsO family protein